MTPRAPAPDQAQRDAAVAERDRNVLVDAGAGTGKTTLLVDRLVEMVAPAGDGPALGLPRVAAITFTRRAAGELRLRVRERLLHELAGPGPSPLRRRRLSDAVAALDTAHVGTIHGFADRLLRLRPVEARLGPSSEVLEDEGALVRETFTLLLQAAQSGQLARELEGRLDPGRAREVQETLLDALRAGLRPESRELEWTTIAGLDALFAGFLRSRDVPPPDAPAAELALPAFRRCAEEFVERARGVRGGGAGSRWMARAAGRLAGLLAEADPVVLFREVAGLLGDEPRDGAGKARDFDGDDRAWDAWHAWIGKARKRSPVRAGALRDDLLAPLHRWMATRLARAFPAVAAMYEKVKDGRRAVDQLDLLLLLRNLLRDDLAVRREYQGLFDHVFVDEFQDTDPLQAEIVLYLCERGAAARAWTEVELAPGKLTLVGDPKQSIYRFRRADIAVYDAVRRVVQRGPCLAVSLTASFRAEPGLVDWLNGRFDEVLGRAGPGAPAFDPRAGTVANEPLAAGRRGRRRACVTVVPVDGGGGSAAAHRAIEAAALAAFLRWMVDGERMQVTDPATGAERPAGYGDVAVLAASTFHLGLLFPELDRLGVPHAARGGTLFLEDPLHRQFLLGLRAVADREDGVAEAALLRPPFFAVDLGELARARVAPEDSADAGVARARAALARVRELRRERLRRPPGQTARDLLEETAFGRAVALGPNGAQRLAGLRELCLELERLAAAEGLDYDAATARMRGWALDPVALDPPRPVGAEAVQVLTIHQAKGLEFPVVVLWDGRAGWDPGNGAAPWHRDGEGWALRLDGLAWEEPPGARILARERSYLEAERKRLVYVAATRARDRLVLPLAGAARPRFVTGRLAAGSPAGLVETMDPFVPGREPDWAREVSPPPGRRLRAVLELAGRVERAWAEASGEAARPRFAPAAVSSEAHAAAAEPEGEAGARRELREGRHGPVFGDTVHRAIGIALRAPQLSAAASVARASRETGLAERLDEAAADVERALAALDRAGLRRAPGPDLRLEYPVAAAWDGKLHAGYVDLLAARDGRIDLVDFKTDAPPAGDVRATHPAYVAQVRSYARILAEAGVAPAGRVRCGLLFTADGGLRWIE